MRKLIAGFKAEGLESGDCVCVHSFNDVGPRTIPGLGRATSRGEG